MQQLVTVSEIREMDRLTIEAGLPGLLLMEHAGMAVADRAVEILQESGGERIAVFCGKGNNGGDGFTAARLLAQSGWRVTVFMTCAPADIRGDASVQFTAMQTQEVEIVALENQPGLENIPSFDLIIDALLGTGIKGEVTGFTADLIDLINRSGAFVLSVDIPSGLQSDSGRFEGACIEADATVTFGKLKRGLVLSSGRELSGVVDVADIGIPEPVAASIHSSAWLIESRDCRDRLPPRPMSAHKGDFGKVAVIAGSRGMTGAACLASTAALKAGCGLVKLVCPAGVNPILESMMPEVMTWPVPETPDGSLALSAVESIRTLLEWADVLAIGPGLSGNKETVSLIREIIRAENRLPVVIDADGLNAFAGHPELLENPGSPRILTPHPGELSKLTGLTIADILADPAETAAEWSNRWQSVLILKGASTCIGVPDGRVFVNTTGNSGMGSGGTGDVLTGITAGLLAQGISPADAAVCSVYLHGLAGDLAAEAGSDRALTAGDLTAFLGDAFLRVEASI